MGSHTLRVVLLLLVAGIAGCGKKAPPPPARETVLGLLRQEAQSLKAEGEKLDPSLGVTSIWNIEAVDVVEQPGDTARPWNGTIRFKIETRSRDITGSITDRTEKAFAYAFDAASSRWRMRP